MIGVIGGIDRPIGAEPERLLQNRTHHVGRDDFLRAVEPGSRNRQGADRTASRHENPFAEQGPGAVDRMQYDREGLRKGRFVD